MRSFCFHWDWGQSYFPNLDPENRALVQLPWCPWHTSVCACVDMWRSQEQKSRVTCWHPTLGYFLMFLVEQIALRCPCPHMWKGRLWRWESVCLPTRASVTTLDCHGKAASHTPVCFQPMCWQGWDPGQTLQEMCQEEGEMGYQPLYLASFSSKRTGLVFLRKQEKVASSAVFSCNKQQNEIIDVGFTFLLYCASSSISNRR